MNYLRIGVFFACSLLVYAQDFKLAPGMLDGRFWTAADYSLRLGYLLGIREYTVSIMPTAAVNKMFPAALTLKELATAMDQFYKEPENLPIPLMFSQQVVTLKANGISEAELSSMIAELRKAAAAQAKKP